MDFILYSILVLHQVNIFLANTIAFLMGTIVNVYLIRSFVFINYRYNFIKDCVISIFTNGVVYLVGLAGMGLLVYVGGVNHYLAKCSVMVGTFFVNFTTRKKLF